MGNIGKVISQSLPLLQSSFPGLPQFGDCFVQLILQAGELILAAGQQGIPAPVGLLQKSAKPIDPQLPLSGGADIPDRSRYTYSQGKQYPPAGRRKNAPVPECARRILICAQHFISGRDVSRGSFL
ncbi:hypothetical protein D3C75_1069210 [compost metagenome]